MKEYTTPDLLTDADETDIMKRMVEDMPIDIDVSEGSVAYDLLHPTAVEVERMKQFDLDYLFQQIWPQFAEGEALDYHGEARGLPRKQPTAASGKLTITGDPGTVILEGDLFATEGIGTIPSVSYASDGEYTIPDTGTVEVNVVCAETGTVGNCTAGKIIIVEDSDDGVTTCTNNEAMTGGTDIEEDDAYRERILYFDQSRTTSYSGTISDYTKWANEVDGVGSAIIIPATDDSGLVTIVITDGNGSPATDTLCKNVYNYIMRPDNPYERLAPINANLYVVPPTPVKLTVTAALELNGTSVTDVEKAFTNAMQQYYPTAISDGEVRYQKVANILGDISGVYDFTGLTINGKSENIPIAKYESPIVEILTFTENRG